MTFQSDQVTVAETKTEIFQHHETVSMLEQILEQSPIIKVNIIVRKCFLIRKPSDFIETVSNLKDKKYSHRSSYLQNPAITKHHN